VATSALSIFLFALGITLPIFVVLFLGLWLARCGKLSEAFIRDANQIIYKIGLPIMLFLTCAMAEFSWDENSALLLAFALMTLIVFFGAWMTTNLLRHTQDLGVIVQGSFRGNLVILGLALAANAYGERGLAMAALPVAFTVLIYNFLSVFILDRHRGLKATLNGIITNPLILAIAAGCLYNLTNLPIPSLIKTTAGYITQMVLPLALICIGGSLNGRRLTHFDSAVISANLWKLVASPAIAIALGLALGVNGEALVILFLLASAPTATVSYVMAEALNANGKLAASIVAQTTFFSLFTVTAGLVGLSYLS
jgi:malonate transporter